MIIDIGCFYWKDTKNSMTTVTTMDSAAHTEWIFFLNCLKKVISLSSFKDVL
jgi:hypothetical protein